MIPTYLPKWLEELARAVAVAVGAYLVTAVSATGIPTTQQAIIALLAGAAPVAWAAIRAALNKTLLTTNGPPPDPTPTTSWPPPTSGNNATTAST